MQTYVSGLSDTQVRSLCKRILCGHGGVGLATSLLQSANEDIQNQASRVAKLHHGVGVATAGLWAPQWKMCAVKRIPVSPDMKSSTFYVSTTWF